MARSRTRVRRPPRGVIPPTLHRRWGDLGHRPPDTGLDATGGRWRGTSRVVNRAALRKANRRSWLRLNNEERADTAAAKRGNPIAEGETGPVVVT